MKNYLNSFPLNLLYRVFRTEEAALKASQAKDFNATLYYVLSLLTSRERQVFNCIYMKSLPYADTAKTLGISRSRVCHVNNDILRKLRSAGNANYLYFGIEEAHRKEIEAYRNEGEKNAEKAYAKGVSDGYEQGFKAGAVNAIKMQDRTGMPITVLKVSNRIIDDLFAHGIRTVGDLLCIENFRTIKDIGSKHNIALIAALKEIGIDYLGMEDLTDEGKAEENEKEAS